MNKKQEMVNQLLDRIETAGVMYQDDTGSDDTTLRARKDFWNNCPAGHYDSDIYPSVEGKLSCLSEESLQRILKEDRIQAGMSFYEMWRAWGRAGYFTTKPEILQMEDRVPILRLRHDCYLHWFRAAGFQNSYDAYCHGSNGASAMSIQNARRAADVPPCYSIFWGDAGEERDDDEVVTEWNSKWALFRKAMFLSYPAQALGGKPVFQQMLRDNPDMFEEFIRRTDNQCAHFNLQESLTVSIMRKQALATEFEWPAVAEVPLVKSEKGSSEPVIFAMLRFSEQQVSLAWSEGGSRKQLTIPFPAWEYEAWENEALYMDLACDHPQCLSQRDYLYNCWVNLAVTLLMLARVDASNYWMAPTRGVTFDTAPLLFNSENQTADGLNRVGSICYELSRKYPGFDDLTAQLMEKSTNS